MHPLGKAGVLYTELLTMLMTSLVRDADALGSIKVEVGWLVLLLYVPSQQLWSLRDGQFT